MIPKVIVVADRIPFTVGGKIDRKAVARQLADAELPAAHAYRAPSTPLESALAVIVGEVLDLAGKVRSGSTTTSSPSVAIPCWPPRWSPAFGTGSTPRR